LVVGVYLLPVAALEVRMVLQAAVAVLVKCQVQAQLAVVLAPVLWATQILHIQIQELETVQFLRGKK
jgi:hypothetical protein